MKIKQKANLITNILNKQYPETPVPLNHYDIYSLLIAVLLSAQCTDKRVNEVTPYLFDIADNPLSMSKLSEKKIYSIIKPCGLGPKKAKAIKLLSKILIKNYQGEVPENLNALENLPGVGHKTASVVMSQGFGHPAFPVDTHIHRLAQRWKLTNGKNVIQTEKDLKRIFPEKSWNKLHLQIIFWGREFCQAHECFALECKICKAINSKRIRPFVHKRP